MHSIPWPYYSHNHPCLSSSGTSVSTKFTATYVHVGWLLNNVAMVWSAYALCAWHFLFDNVYFVSQCICSAILFLWRSNYKLAYLLPQLNVSIVSYWSIIVFLFILFLYAVSYTEFESYSSSSTLNSTCDIPVLPNDRKCWARGREGEGGGGREQVRNDFKNVYIHCYSLEFRLPTLHGRWCQDVAYAANIMHFSVWILLLKMHTTHHRRWNPKIWACFRPQFNSLLLD